MKPNCVFVLTKNVLKCFFFIINIFIFVFIYIYIYFIFVIQNERIKYFKSIFCVQLFTSTRIISVTMHI